MTKERAKQLRNFAESLQSQAKTLRQELEADPEYAGWSGPSLNQIGWSVSYMNNIIDDFGKIMGFMSVVAEKEAA